MIYKIAVVAHIFYEDLLEEIFWYIRNIPINFDLYISTREDLKERIDNLSSIYFINDRVKTRTVKNKGRDISPFVIEFKDVYKNYDLICKIHSKKSDYNKKLSEWRSYLLNNLLGSQKIVSNILDFFENDSKLGIFFPRHFSKVKEMIEFGGNFQSMFMLLKIIEVAIYEKEKINFPSGSMFRFRPKALDSLFKINFTYDDFEDDSAEKIDGTLAHAIERIILSVAEKDGYKWKQFSFFDS